MSERRDPAAGASRRHPAAVGVAISTALLLAYALYRPESLEFSVPFLIGPSLALLWSTVWNGTEQERRVARAVTVGVALGVAAVAAITVLR